MTRTQWISWMSAALTVAALGMLPSSAMAQRPRIGIAPVSLTRPSYVFDTAEQHKVRVVVVTQGLVHPFAVALLPDGDALVAERGGELRIVHGVTEAGGKAAVLDPQPIAGIPQLSKAFRGGGLQDVELDPDFARNGLVYFTFNEPGKMMPGVGKRPASRLSILTLMRGQLSGHALHHVRTLWSAKQSGVAGGSRIAFGRDGMIYIADGGPYGNVAQNLDSVYGKVLRLRRDGKVPPGNPFVGHAGARPEIYAYGFRDQLGLTVDPLNGEVLDAEEGPDGGDTVNVILPGRNYGWPKYSFGHNYDGSPISRTPLGPGIEPPLLVWIPDIALGNLVVYTGKAFPAWHGNLLVTSAQRGDVPHTGGLSRVVLNPKMQELRREFLLAPLHQRLRDVRQGADGLLYAVTDEQNGALLRIEPAAAGAEDP